MLDAGLLGGHSGLNIDEDRGNAVKFIAQVVDAILEAVPQARWHQTESFISFPGILVHKVYESGIKSRLCCFSGQSICTSRWGAIWGSGVTSAEAEE